MMEYKGYTGRIRAVDEKQGLLHGVIDGINDVVTFEAKNVAELVKAFRDSVEDYLAFCEAEEEPPEKPFSGKFLVRIPTELHRKASHAARQAGESLNAWVASAITTRLDHAAATNASPAEEEEMARLEEEARVRAEAENITVGRRRQKKSQGLRVS